MRFLVVLTLVMGLAACGHQDSPNTILVGTIAGPETDLVTVAAEVAQKKYGLIVKTVEFNDYNLPNSALEDGSLDANIYQHLPYLQAAMKSHKYKLEVVGKTFIYPTGIYSNKVKSLAALPEGATIALPNDPSNEARALLLLKKAGLITLKDQSNQTIQDIQTNPHKFHFKELDAAQLPRVLEDVDAAVINTTFAIPAGLMPSRDALYTENKDSPYANLVVIRRDSHKRAQVLQLVKALHSDAVLQKAKALFGEGGAEPAW